MQSEPGICFDFVRAKEKLEALKYKVTLDEGTFLVEKSFTGRKFSQRCRTACELRILAEAIDQFYTNPTPNDFVDPCEHEVTKLPKAIQVATFLLDESVSFIVQRSLPNTPVSWKFVVHSRDKELLRKAVI